MNGQSDNNGHYSSALRRACPGPRTERAKGRFVLRHQRGPVSDQTLTVANSQNDSVKYLLRSQTAFGRCSRCRVPERQSDFGVLDLYAKKLSDSPLRRVQPVQVGGRVRFRKASWVSRKPQRQDWAPRIQDRARLCETGKVPAFWQLLECCKSIKILFGSNKKRIVRDRWSRRSSFAEFCTTDDDYFARIDLQAETCGRVPIESHRLRDRKRIFSSSSFDPVLG